MVAGREATRHNLIASSSLRHIWRLFQNIYPCGPFCSKLQDQSILVLACDQVSSNNKLNFDLKNVCWHKMSLIVLFIFLCFKIVSHLNPFYQDQAKLYLTDAAFAWAGSSSRVCSSHSYSSNQPFVHQTSTFFTKITQIHANPPKTDVFLANLIPKSHRGISISSS